MDTGSDEEMARLQALDRAHFLHPFTDHRALAARGTRVIHRADGVWIEAHDGRRLLDAMSGLWCVNIGYGRQSLAETAYRQMQVLPYYNSFFQCSHPQAIELARELCAVAPAGMDKVFFTNSGSEANDTVIRMVRHYWALRGQPQRQVIVSRHRAYHGSTVGGASLSGMPWMHAQGGLPIPGIVHIRPPHAFDLAQGRDAQAFGLDMAAELEAVIRQLGAERVAAFIGEPVQGAGGAIIPPDSYWPEIQRICRVHGILLVADEVITGFGRLGHWFGVGHYGVQPDLITFAKGVTSGYQPLGGVLVGERVAGVLVEEGGEFHHGFTWSGHPVACAVARENLRILRDENIIGRARDEVIPHFAACWQRLAAHPLVGEARSAGLIGAIELVADKATLQRFPAARKAGEVCRDICIHGQGLVMRAVGDTMIVAPPLVIGAAETEMLVERAWQALDLTACALAR